MAAQILIDGDGLLADMVFQQLFENHSLKRQSIFGEVSKEIEFVLVTSRCLAPHPFIRKPKKE